MGYVWGYFCPMPFKSKGRDFYKVRVTGSDGRSLVAGCGTDDLNTAKAIERMVRDMRRRRDWTALDLIVDRRVKLPEVFDAYDSGNLARFIQSLDAIDVAALLKEWKGNAKYVTQIRCLVGDSMSADEFNRARISRFLADLKVSPSTKNRYRSAISVFAAWLVERDIIPHNPVKDVKGYKPKEREPVWLERPQAQALIGALSHPSRALEALMAATGVEWQVIERLVARDIDFKAKTVHARGSKTRWRNRIVRATEMWAWDIFADYARGFSPNALVFGGVDKYASLRRHQNASKLLNLPRTTLHDWRHTYSVQSLRDGYKPSVIAHQLGHHDANLVISRYGRWIPDARDYEIQAAVPLAHASGREE